MDYSHVVGSSFGELTVTAHTGIRDRMLCVCSCGAHKEARLSHLRFGSVKSCGCLLKTRPREVFGKTLMAHTRVYKVWNSMVDRCTKPHHHAYKHYGARGISVCERWLKFENFLNDMGPQPSGLSLDRINNNLGYSAENCRWTDRFTQARNRRSSRLLTARGETRSLTEWATAYGILDTTIAERINRGWSEERAITTPVKRA